MVQIDASDPMVVVIQATQPYAPASCSRCGSQKRPARHGMLEAHYRDAPFIGRQVTIAVEVQRYRCPDCGQTFLQDLTGMDAKRRMTSRCCRYIIDQVMTRSSMNEVARIVGVDEKTIRNVFDDRGVIFSVGDPPSDNRFVCESCLGIYPKLEHRLISYRHFGNWRSGDLLRDANVCKECFEFAKDPWRSAVSKRSLKLPRTAATSSRVQSA